MKVLQVPHVKTSLASPGLFISNLLLFAYIVVGPLQVSELAVTLLNTLVHEETHCVTIPGDELATVAAEDVHLHCVTQLTILVNFLKPMPEH